MLFLIFFSVLFGFVFNIAHKYAYVDIKFIEYEESYESRVILNIKKGNRTLKKILTNITEKENKFEIRKGVEYNNPFKFRESDVLENKKTEIIISEMENNLTTHSIFEVENGTINKND